MALSQELAKAGLSERWLGILRETLGVQTAQGLKYVGVESYPLLVQFVCEPQEKLSLLSLLRIEKQFLMDYNRRFLEKKVELVKSLKQLEDMQTSGNYRQDGSVKAVESYCQEILQVQESEWVGEKLILSDVIEKLRGMVECFGSVHEDDDLNGLAFLLQVSGGLSLESLRGLAFKGIWVRDELQNFFEICSSNMLKAPSDIELSFPMRPLFAELKYFQTRSKEKEFFNRLEKCGCSPPMEDISHSDSEAYCSTIKYYFVPMASYFFDNHHLFLSDYALSHLSKIDHNLAEDKQSKAIQKECEEFFNEFGSHCLQGPFHFGGMYICKCYSSGFPKFAKVEELKKIQRSAIDAQVCMCFSPCVQETNVSQLKGVTGPERLKGTVKLQVLTVGGSEKAMGFADWKNSLNGSNKRWKLIDCGTNKVPVWDIVVLNHKKHFQNAERLSSTLRQCWINQNLKRADEASDSHLKKFCKFVKSLQLEETKLHTQLNMLVTKRNEVEEQLCDPEAWALKYLPNLQEYFHFIIRTCKGVSLEKLNCLLKRLVEPVDLGITQVFPSESFKYVLQYIYSTEEDLPPLLYDDFVRFGRYINQALTIFGKGSVPHPYLISLGTSLVEKAVSLYRHHLLKTGQEYEECLLLTILHAQNYNPEKRRFLALVSKNDIVSLKKHFINWSNIFFKLDQQNELQKQAYLMYLTVCVSRTMGATEECIKSHVNFLQQKFQPKPEIQSLLKTGIDWNSFHDQMKDMFKDAVSLPLSSNPHTISSAKKEQSQVVQALQHPLMAKQNTSESIDMPSQPQQFGVAQKPRTTEHFATPSLLQKPAIKQNQTTDIPGPPQKLAPGQTCILQSRISGIQHHPNPPIHQQLKSLLENIGLADYFPQKLSRCDAIQIREDTIKLSHDHTNQLYPFIMLQKIMAFDSKCRITFHRPQNKESVSGGDSDSESDESETDDSVHPMVGLIALILCCDNFLRQDLFCRMATCHIAIPLLLPYPHTKDPTLLLWAMRGIVKEFKLSDGKTQNSRIISYPTPFVSFVRVGEHSISKSEILNGVMNKTGSDSKIEAFIGYNSPGGTCHKCLVKGLVEVSWYLPGNGLFSKPIAFTNLRGDACNPDLQKQVKFLSSISTVVVVLLSVEDAYRDSAITLLKTFLHAPGGLIILQSKTRKGFKTQISEYIGEDVFKSTCTVVNCDKSATVFLENLQVKLRNKLEATYAKPELVSAAKKWNIKVDEDTSECVKGRECMEKFYKVIDDFRKMYPKKSPKDLLPLQSKRLWHKLADLDKEQYRQKRKYQHKIKKEPCEGKGVQRYQEGKLEWTAREYGEEQRRKMNEIRKRQYPLAKERNSLTSLFLETLKKEEKSILHYFMIWLKFKLDDLSREILPPFYVDIRNKRKELDDIQQKRDKAAEKRCQDELKNLDNRLLNASFGLEHLFREVGQMYEAVVEQTDDILQDLPQKAAELLVDGFPLELLDGDASHVPKKWISAVLNSLADILQQKHGFDPHIYILSVLGVQSTGKSTLLNTVFGVQFSVSAGRCTRGAFMQLIPVHRTLHKKTGVQYFLLIDTEGLRAPELDRLEVCEHDNELATFVIGMANLTLINVSGEVSGDMDDILHTVVHAFLRMNQVQLKPSCHIIHQHVVAVGADEKMMQGRLKTKDNLDKMTKAAAKETGVEMHYTHFSDVIKFDHEHDVSFFPDLWNGKPPMARVSSGYSEEAQNLKLSVITNSTATTKYSVLHINKHLQSLWKAILQEDFVFTFQNTFEIIAFKTLEGKFGDWSWSFKSDMSEWERMAEKKICGCSPDILDDVRAQLLQSLQVFANKKYREYERTMLEYFDESNNEIMLKWKPDMVPRLKNLCQTLEQHADEHCVQVYQSQKDRAEADNERGKLNTMILEYIQQLIVTLGETKKENDELIKIFDEQWRQWMKQLTSRIIPFKKPNVEEQMEVCIYKDFTSDQSKFLNEKLGHEESGKRLRDWGRRLVLYIKDCHIKVLQQTAWGTSLIPFWSKQPKIESFFPLAQQHTKNTLSAVETHLKSIKHSDRNFSPQLVQELLQLIKSKRKTDLEGFQLTEEYDVDLALTACGHAIKYFEEMAESFRRKHDPTIYVECEMKPQFQKIFLNMYARVGNEKIVADTLCQQLEEPVKEYVIESLPSLIVSEMRGKYPYIKDKQSFIANMLLEIGEKLNSQDEDGFKLCILFLTDARSSIEWWADHFVQEHCKSGSPSRLSVIATCELNDMIDGFVNGAKDVTTSLADQQSFPMNEWLQKFNSVALEGKVNIKHQMYITSQELSDLNFFKKEVIRGLNELRNKLKKFFSDIEYLDITRRNTPHEIIFEMVSGCTEQCPFCKAQCELTEEKHSTTGNIKHQTQHRPRCLGGRSWEEDKTMVLDVCTYSVSDSNTNFRTEHTEWKWHAYKEYSKIYPEWIIPADKSLESSLYWKWFIGNYSSKVEDFFGHEHTKIPEEWTKVRWAEVKEWLKREYQL